MFYETFGKIDESTICVLLFNVLLFGRDDRRRRYGIFALLQSLRDMGKIDRIGYVLAGYFGNRYV